MYCMLSCFNLKSDVTKASFCDALGEFFTHMHSVGLIDSIGPLCERDADTPMDTDQRNLQYFFLSYFVDKAQCDRSYQYIMENQGIHHPTHAAVHSKTTDAIFICYSELI